MGKIRSYSSKGAPDNSLRSFDLLQEFALIMLLNPRSRSCFDTHDTVSYTHLTLPTKA